MCNVAALVDTVGSAALSTIVNHGQVSTHMSIDYLAPVKLGDTAVVDATVLNKGSRTGVIEVRLCSRSFTL
jgi:acyl-coenzyme A thioesterase PaaI-like protein